jgi:hypothetical protein
MFWSFTMKKFVSALALLALFFCHDVFAQDPLQAQKYDFVYERERQNAYLEWHHKTTYLANNVADAQIGRAIEEWKKDGDQNKFDRATEVILNNYRTECARLKKILEKRMRWAENNLHAHSLEEALQAEARLMNRELKRMMRFTMN